MSFEDEPSVSVVAERPLDGSMAICDPHHHLWDHDGDRYMLDELAEDRRRGHRFVSSVYVECGSAYDVDTTEALRPVGETRFAAGQASLQSQVGGPPIGGIVAHADLRVGEAVTDVLDAHANVADGLLRGIRQATACDTDPSIADNWLGVRPGTMASRAFRRGLEAVAAAGLVADVWLYFPQLDELIDAARAVPGLTFVLDHLGGPLGIGRHADLQRSRSHWRELMTETAQCENVVVKLGGIGMPMFGSGAPRRSVPTSADIAARWGNDVRFAIDTFGPSRCMFESNFPVDRHAMPLTVQWNAFQRIASGYSPSEQRSLFHDTATRVYELGTVSPAGGVSR